MGDETNPLADDSWLRRIIDGESDFAEGAVARFSDRLIRLAKSRMSSKLAQRVDPEDVVQSVFRSFFRRHSEKEFKFSETNDVWRLLAAITYRKTQESARYHQRMMRDVRRESTELFSNECNLTNSKTPTASTLVGMQDLLDQILQKLPPSHHQILLLRLEQFSIDEIAFKTGLSTRTIDRSLSLMREIAKQLIQSD